MNKCGKIDFQRKFVYHSTQLETHQTICANSTNDVIRGIFRVHVTCSHPSDFHLSPSHYISKCSFFVFRRIYFRRIHVAFANNNKKKRKGKNHNTQTTHTTVDHGIYCVCVFIRAAYALSCRCYTQPIP